MKTTIATIRKNSIEILGLPIAELMESRSFAGLILEFCQLGEVDKRHYHLVNMMMVGFCDHGLSPPSTICARLAASCDADLSKALIAALATMGDTHVPIVEACRFFREALEMGIDVVDSHPIIPGYGHPIHDTDPRVPVLMKCAAQFSDMPCCALARQIERRIGVGLNYAGAVAAISCDLGIPAEFAQLIAILGRLIGLTAHVREQRESPKRVICYDASSTRFVE